MKRNEGLQVARKSRMMRHVGISLFALFAAATLLSMAAQAQTNPYGKDLYVRGGMNSWGTSDQMTFEDGIFKKVLALNAGSIEFKIADANWTGGTNFGAGGDGAVVSLGTTKTLSDGSQTNLRLTLAESGNYKFTLTPTDPLTTPDLLVQKLCAASPWTGDVFLRGSMNGWETANKMNFADCEYTALMYLAADTYQFKVADTNYNPVNFGGTADPETVALNTAETLSANGNNLQLVIAQGGWYKFKLDVVNSSAPVLTVVASSSTKAMIHYYRPANDYDGWGLDLTGSTAPAAGEMSGVSPFDGDPVNLGTACQAQTANIELADLAGTVQFKVLNGSNGDPNTTTTRSFIPNDNMEVWVVQGDATLHTTANAAKIAAGCVGDLTHAKALWLDAATIAYNGDAGDSYKLLYDADGAMDTATAGATECAFPSPAGPCYVTLTNSGTISGYWKNPNATDKPRMLTGLSDENAKHLLKGELVVVSYVGAQIADKTRVQIQSVLDAIYADVAKDATLGVTYSGGNPTVKVWAPTAKSVKLRRFADSSTATYTEHAMTEDAASGVWSVTGASEWNRQFYLFDVEVFVPSLGTVTHNLVTDPYSVSLSQDGQAPGDVRSQFVNLDDADLKPAEWDGLTKPALAAPEDIVVYEAHVRDFSINDSSLTNSAYKGTFMAFTDLASNGMKHLLALKDAGLTHIHLLPSFDIASVTENKSERVEPTISISSRDSEDAQAADRSKDGFNWGYDPYHYGVPEGSYSTDPNGPQRIREFREMVKSLNASGLRVVMDMVYNHTAASGQDDKSVMDKVVPGYYYRYDINGNLQNSSCCSDTACEYTMMEKLMIDTVERFATAYKVDGFRFDLMNLHTRQNMLNLKDRINAVDPNIYLYGEGWDFGSLSGKGLTTCPNCYAKQWNMKGTGIGTFNDKIRDAAHGGYSTDSTGIRHQGFINGLSYDWNGYEYGGRYQSDLWNAMGTLRMTLKGTVDDYTDDPQESINYVEKHDNETLFDQNVFKMPIGASMADRVRAQNMGMSIVGLAQGIPFIQMGSDMLRSKSLDRNSYDSGDWFNKVYWDYSENNFGKGLPPSNDNSSRWAIMRPLLTNTALDPTTDDIQSAAAHLREVLRIRKSSKLFRLETKTAINDHVRFYNAGASPQDALIVMSLMDGANLDENYETILVLFNANKVQQTFTIAEAIGKGFALHPLQLDDIDADAVVKTAAFDDATGQFTIPARTTAVFVSTQLMTQPLPASTIDWVGSMWPKGGAANAINQGATTGLDVYVQVFEDGVTAGSGAGAGIQCSLHWGKYGAAWTDIAMTYHTDKDNNDEYKATIPASALAQPGNYGFTANCNKSGEDKKWNADGDGLLTVIPTADSSPNGNGDVFVHLFEWKWTDIQKECAYLAQKGYKAVQVSPPMEHIVPKPNMGGEANDYPWWVRYQPVTHDVAKMDSRSGTKAEFQSMIDACNAVGVDIYVDAVFNQMAKMEVVDEADGKVRGTAGTEYDSDAPTYGEQYAASDFRNDCSIASYSVRSQVQGCRLSTMPDLDTSNPAVQTKIRIYLQGLLDMGVKGFRIDAAKHIAAPEVAAILNGLTLQGGGKPYIFQETIDVSSGEPIRDWEYTPSGDVTEFGYAQAMANKFNQCGGTLSDLENLSSSADLMPSRFAVVFTDNHDNQRGHGAGGNCIVDHRDGATHELANIFVLAYPYGYPSIMSSYYWSDDPATNTGDSLGPPSASGGAGSGAETLPVYVGDVLTNCSATYADGKWVCEHRRVSTANMVQFRKVTAGEDVTNWQTISPNHIAFGRNGKGFVAMNRESAAATTTYATGMAAGTYCDVTQGELAADGKSCVGQTILVDGNGNIVNYTLAEMDAFAIHSAAFIDTAAPTVTIAPAAYQPNPTSSSPILFTVTFSEAVTGFESADVTMSGAAGATTAVVMGSGATYRVAVSGMTGNGAVTVTLAAGVAADAAGNVNTASDGANNSVAYDMGLPLLMVKKSGAGRGIVTSSLGGITCGADCREGYSVGTTVTLTATPSADSVFVGWTEGCAGTGACVVNITSAATVQADFALSVGNIGETWSPWALAPKKAVSSAVTMATLNAKLYQSVRGADLYVWTRATTDGDGWQAWNSDGTVKIGAALSKPKTSSGMIASQEFGGHLYQVMRQRTSNRVLTRQLDVSPNWTADAATGYYRAGGNITMAAFTVGAETRLYQATRALATTNPRVAANAVLWRYATTWPAAWKPGAVKDGWMADVSRKVASDLTMTVFNSGTGDRLYQTAIEAGTRKVITRYTSDGTTWSAWSVDASSMKAFGNVTMAVFNGRLYQAMRQFNALTPGVGKVWTRSTADGVTWSAWEYAGLKAKQPAALEVAAVNNQTRLYLAINSGGKVRTRYTANGVNWTAWVTNGATANAVTLKAFNPTPANPSGQRLYLAAPKVVGATKQVVTSNIQSAAVAVPQFVTMKKSGAGNGTITAGEWVCGATCQELQIPVIAGVTISVTPAPDANSTFAGWQTTSGAVLTGVEYVQPGDTVMAVFDQK